MGEFILELIFEFLFAPFGYNHWFLELLRWSLILFIFYLLWSAFS